MRGPACEVVQPLRGAAVLELELPHVDTDACTPLSYFAMLVYKIAQIFVLNCACVLCSRVLLVVKRDHQVVPATAPNQGH